MWMGFEMKKSRRENKMSLMAMAVDRFSKVAMDRF
jgi:hypothetical protein